MRTPIRILTAGIAAALLVLGTTACASDGGNNDPGTSGGISAITVRGCTPQSELLPTNTNEVCGGNILDATEAKLIHYNADDASPELDIAESIETDDAINWTVKLKPGYMFQDGTEVKAHNFVDAWNWGAYGPNAQMNEYFFEMIEGYEDMQCGDADCKEVPVADSMKGLEVLDDYTFTIRTVAPTSNLTVRLGYTAFAPQPDAFFASEDKLEFAKKPIAAGPFQVTSKTDTEIVIEKFEGYSGKFPGSVDKVTFKIYNDSTAAYQDVVANNLDVTDLIPADYLVADMWKQDLVDSAGAPRWGTKDTGVFQALTFSPAKTDPGMADIRVRQAISMAVDRSQVVDIVFNNARVAATGWTSPVVDGFSENQCTNCVFDPDRAKELLAEAGGYPGPLELWINGDGGHQQWADAVCNQIKNNLELECLVQATPDFATLRNKIKARELKGIMRAGWQMDYPSIENFLTPLYATGASANDSDFSNANFDRLLREAAAATTNDAANLLYQEAERVLDQEMPAMPLWTQQSQYGFSTNIKSIKMTPFSTFDFGSVVLAS
ncbi:MAG: ABC transporter substrate-binding protein [Propionibacteriaceae bacterium]|jgi:oligopeptide transport system substrate-binding protein|nr:ABC transporter substrate-binding protein [Propionibacteriaceae bacterium]